MPLLGSELQRKGSAYAELGASAWSRMGNVSQSQDSAQRFLSLASSLALEHAGLAAAKKLTEIEVPVMVLKGPVLQRRLYGIPNAYRSTDVDLLVPKKEWRRALHHLLASGWQLDIDRSLFWKLSRAVSLTREGLLDLHWGLHAGHLPSFIFHRLEESMWAHARPRSDGTWEPDDIDLALFLSLHASGHRFERAYWIQNAKQAIEMVSDEEDLWRRARTVGLEKVLGSVIWEQFQRVNSLSLFGPLGSLVSVISWIVRGHMIPTGTRVRIRNGLRRVIGRTSG